MKKHLLCPKIKIYSIFEGELFYAHGSLGQWHVFVIIRSMSIFLKYHFYSNLGSQRILIFFLIIHEDKRELHKTILAVLRVGSLLLDFEQAFFLDFNYYECLWWVRWLLYTNMLMYEVCLSKLNDPCHSLFFFLLNKNHF